MKKYFVGCLVSKFICIAKAPYELPTNKECKQLK